MNMIKRQIEQIIRIFLEITLKDMVKRRIERIMLAIS